MEFLEPIERIVGEEGGDFLATEIVDRGVPVRVVTLTWIGVLIECGAVEMCQPVLVGWKVRRHPVEDDAKARFVRDIDEVLEPGRIAKARSRREQTCRLIAPTGIERML
jgi:hypothetical protein